MSELEQLIFREVQSTCAKVAQKLSTENLPPALDPNIDVLTSMKDICEFTNMSRNTYVKAYNNGEFGKAAWRTGTNYYFRKSLFGKVD
jgi:hypothetical protein